MVQLITDKTSRFRNKLPLIIIVPVTIFILHFIYLIPGRLDMERHMVQTDFDLQLPFIKGFVLPYAFWYVFVIASYLVYLCHDHKDLVDTGIYDMTGLIICCLVFFIYPTEIGFRPEVIEGNDLCSGMLRWMFNADGPYSVLPSMHCYEATVVCVGILSSRHFRGKAWAKIAAVIIAVLICISTLLIKQHSILDLIAGVGLALVLIPVMDIVRKNITEKAKA